MYQFWSILFARSRRYCLQLALFLHLLFRHWTRTRTPAPERGSATIFATYTSLASPSQTFDLNSYPRTAEGIASFVEARTKLKVGEIVRPPPLNKLQVSLIFAAVLLLGPYIGYKVLSLPAVQEPKLWAIAAIGVYYFSVSGGMYNIIRGIPWATADERGKPVFFHQGQGYQLGGEGFYAGLFYLVTSLLLFIMTYVVPRLKSKSSQRLWSAICLFLGFWVVTQFVALYKWKSGYYVHSYWPKRR